MDGGPVYLKIYGEEWVFIFLFCHLLFFVFSPPRSRKSKTRKKRGRKDHLFFCHVSIPPHTHRRGFLSFLSFFLEEANDEKQPQKTLDGASSWLPFPPRERKEKKEKKIVCLDSKIQPTNPSKSSRNAKGQRRRAIYT